MENWELFQYEQGLERIKNFSKQNNCPGCKETFEHLLNLYICFNESEFKWDGNCSDCGLHWSLSRYKETK